MTNKIYISPNTITPSKILFIDSELCNSCNKCVSVCRRDVLLQNPVKGNPPIAMYPDECWLCGCCVQDCPVQGAIRLEYPLNMRLGWKRKETGEYFRIGMKNPPPPNTRPAVG